MTLGPSRPDTDSPDPSLATQRKLLFDPDDSQLTDDDEQDDDKENRREDSPERVNLVAVHIKQRYSEAVTTLTEELDLQMSKLELSLTQPLTDDQKLSEPLFNTESEDDQYPAHVELEVALSHQDSIISMDSVLTISSVNTSVATLEGHGADANEIIILDDDEDEEASRHPLEETGQTDPDPSIEDPSLVDNSQEFSGSLPSKSSEPNCSAPNQDHDQVSLLTSSVLRRLSDFFNKIPDYSDPAPLPGRAVEMAEETKMDETIPETPPESPTADKTRSAEIEDEILIESTDDGSVIDNSYEHVFNPPQLQSAAPMVVAKQKGTQEIKIRSQVSEDNKVINISAKIKVDIVIRTQEASSSSEEEPEEPDDAEVEQEATEESVYVKQEKDVAVVKEEKRTPISEAEPSDPDTTVASEDSPQPWERTEDNADDADHLPQRTSQEIAEADTQSNSPPRAVHALSLCSAPIPSPSFKRFEDTPKGLKQKASEMDTALSATSQKIAEMDTVANTEHMEVSMGAGEGVSLDQEPEPAADSIVLDEESIAILHSIYGDNWRTPQLMRSMKRTPEGGSSADSSFQPNMTDFQKCKCCTNRLAL